MTRPDQVERFSVGDDPEFSEMHPAPAGRWVRYSDYEKLEAVEHDIRVRAEDRLERLDKAEAERDRFNTQADELADDAIEAEKALAQRDEELRERLEKALRETWCDNEDCACCRERAVAARSIFEEAEGG